MFSRPLLGALVSLTAVCVGLPTTALAAPVAPTAQVAPTAAAPAASPARPASPVPAAKDQIDPTEKLSWWNAVAQNRQAFVYGSTGATLTLQVRLESAGYDMTLGTFRVYDGARLAATRKVTRVSSTVGRATWRMPARSAVGTHKLRVYFVPGGEAFDSGWYPAEASVQVLPRQTITVARSRTSYRRGTTGAVVRVRVAGAPVRATGAVTLWAGTTKVGRKALPASGTVSFRLPTWLTPRTHTVRATFTPRNGTLFRSASKSVKVTVVNRKRVVADSTRRITSTSGQGSTTNATGADVERLVVNYLRRLGARNVTVLWSARPCWRSTAATNRYCTWGYVYTTSTTVMRLGASGDFSHAEARRHLMFVAAHEYAHLLQNRAFGKGMVDYYQADKWTERQADCTAAVLTGLSVRAHGAYTKSCTGKLASTSKVLARGARPSPLGF